MNKCQQALENEKIEQLNLDVSCLHEAGEISDGYHTFGELYAHRHALFIALMRSNPKISWRANNNDDGESYDGWFVAGIHLPSGDISYHLPADMWTDLDNTGIKTSNCAPKFDGHTSKDVLIRLKQL